MRTTTTPRRRLRELLQRDHALIAAGACSPMAARLVEQASFDDVYMPGGGVALDRLDVTDLGLATMNEMVETASAITQCVGIPLIADADPAQLRDAGGHQGHGELGICTVAQITGAHYEYHHHAPDYLAADGPQACLDALKIYVETSSDAQPLGLVGDEALVTRYAAQMTRPLRVDDALLTDEEAARHNAAGGNHGRDR